MTAELDALWHDVAHIARARVGVVADALAATRDGAPDAAARRLLAFDECHKLVGSLDSYGRTGGSALALATAGLLAAAVPDLAALTDAVVRLEQVTA